MGQTCTTCVKCGKPGVERWTKQGDVQVLCHVCGKGLRLHEDPYAHYKRPIPTSRDIHKSVYGIYSGY